MWWELAHAGAPTSQLKIGKHDTHPYADDIDLLEGEELEMFHADIKLRGLLDDRIWTYEGKVLEGRDRYIAAEKFGLKVKLVEYTGDDPIGFIISKWRMRKHHNQTQRALFLQRLLARTQGRRSKRTTAERAAAAGVSERYMQYAATIQEGGAPELVAAAARGEVNAAVAADIAKLPKDEQLERLQAELAPAPRPRPRNDSRTEQSGPAAVPAILRVVRAAIEKLGGTIKTLRSSADHADLVVAYSGTLVSLRVSLVPGEVDA